MLPHLPNFADIPRVAAAAFQADFDTYLERVEKGAFFVIVSDEGSEAVIMPAGVYEAYQAAAGTAGGVRDGDSAVGEHPESEGC